MQLLSAASPRRTSAMPVLRPRAENLIESNGSMSALAFHEKAGRCQQLLWVAKFISDVFLCPDIRRFWAGEAAVKAERKRVHLEP